MLFQQDCAGIQTVAVQCHDAIGGAERVSDAAGIQKPCLSAPIHQGPVGVAEEKQVQIFFFCSISGRKKRLLDAVRMAVAELNALALQTKDLFGRLRSAVIAVPRHLTQGDIRKVLRE